MVFALDRQVFEMPGHLINRAARMLARAMEAKFHPLGLAVAQIPVLAALKDGSSLPQKELARLAQIEQPTMAQLLDRMERDGLIERTPDENDRRSSLIALSSTAIKKLPKARALLLEGNAGALKGFSEREIATLSRLLMRVLLNLEASS
jgi:MarR family transcriptional regulator, transcriptional regulator for hemolysin